MVNECRNIDTEEAFGNSNYITSALPLPPEIS